MNNPFDMSKEDVKQILESPHDFDWTLQGFGMLRMYLDPDKRGRLHVWSRGHRVKDMWDSFSDVHTHPWDFTSTVIAGALVNMRYEWVTGFAGPYTRNKMVPGAGAHLLTEDSLFGWLHEKTVDVLAEGEDYAQAFDEIHRSIALSGTCTIIDRDRGDRPDEAYTFYKGDNWVSAEPRPATKEEIDEITSFALKVWF